MMKIRIPKKHVAVGIAALMLVFCYHLDPVIAETITQTDAETDTAVTPETETEESEAESEESISSVTVVHTAEITEDNYAPTDWWKADLEEYDDSLSLVKYETVESADSEDAVLIAEGTSNDVIVSNTPTASAVSSVSDGYFAFTTYGYGHGVGMSQNGANYYATYAGWSYQDILFHYYPGTVLMNTGTAETETVTVQGVSGNVLQQVSEIVYREIGSSMNTEAIKAQAVAVYTYIKYYNNDAHDLKGKANPPQSLVNTCASVLGEALYYNGSYALTMFYASSGGITANCSDVFTVDIPYLRSVASVYDSTYDPHYGTVIYYTVDELRTKLQNAYGIKLSSNPENWITIVEGNGGYANKVIIDGQITVRGNSFRSTMGFKSPKFTYICSVSNETEAAAEETTPVSSSTSSAKTEPTTEAAAPSVTETEAAATEATVASEAEIDNAAVSAQSENEDSLE